MIPIEVEDEAPIRSADTGAGSWVVRPTRRAVWALLPGLLLAALPAMVHAGLWGAYAAYWAVFAAVLGVELSRLPSRRGVGATVSVPATVGLGEEVVVAVVLRGVPRGGHFALELRPPLAIPRGETLHAPSEDAPTKVSCATLRRGTGAVEAVWVRVSSSLGFMALELRLPVSDVEVAVIPSVRRMRESALRFFSDASREVGVKVEKHRGDGSEFYSLMEFQPGLDHRRIDWKSSARHGKLLVRLNRVERNHHVVLVVDTGRTMAEPISPARDGTPPVPRLDHAIDAALLLGWISVRAGDRVSLVAYDDEPRLALEARSGVTGFSQLVAATARLAYSAAETNHTVGLTALLGRLKRRSLVIVLTDFTDSVTAELMVQNLGRLAARHLVLFVGLQNPALSALTDATPSTHEALAGAVVAHSHLLDRQRVLRRLQQAGVSTVDLPAHAVGPAAVNRYLDLKRRERIG